MSGVDTIYKYIYENELFVGRLNILFVKVRNQVKWSSGYVLKCCTIQYISQSALHLYVLYMQDYFINQSHQKMETHFTGYSHDNMMSLLAVLTLYSYVSY